MHLGNWGLKEVFRHEGEMQNAIKLNKHVSLCMSGVQGKMGGENLRKVKVRAYFCSEISFPHMKCCCFCCSDTRLHDDGKGCMYVSRDTRISRRRNIIVDS